MSDKTFTEPLAPTGKIYVCGACGKTSRGLYGLQSDYGWDESCILNAVVADENKLIRGAGGRVVQIDGEVERP